MLNFNKWTADPMKGSCRPLEVPGV